MTAIAQEATTIRKPEATKALLSSLAGTSVEW